MDIFESGDNVRIEITVKRRSGRAYAAYDPSGGCLITITDPSNSVVADEQTMTNEGTGLYYYNYQTGATAKRGIYKIRIEADDGTYSGMIEEDGFKVK